MRALAGFERLLRPLLRGGRQLADTRALWELASRLP